MVRIAALIACLGLLVLVPAASAKSCGSTSGGFNRHITATGATCSTARAVARGWLHSVERGHDGTRRVIQGFACVNTPIPQNSAAVHVRCTRGGAVIKWVAAP